MIGRAKLLLSHESHHSGLRVRRIDERSLRTNVSKQICDTSLAMRKGYTDVGVADSGMDVWTKFPCNTRLDHEAPL